MVKNLPSVERSQKIRLGKFTPDVQATDTIVINATSDDITTSDSGLYVAPIRYDATPGAANTIGYDQTTKEIVQTSFPVNQTQGLQEVTSNGAVTTLGVEVSNTFTATRVQVGSGASADDVNVFVVRGGVLIEGNLVATGDTTFVRSNNVSITDPLLELGGNNNSESFVYDVGIIMNRPGENVGFAYLETRDELTVALTSNTATDRFIETSSNLLTMNVVGDVYANAFFGEGSTLTNVAHLVDFQSNVTRIGDLETSLTSNAQRVGYLETVHASNAQRLSTLETYHDDNVIRLNLLYNLQASNAAELTTLNAWHHSNVTRISNLETWLDDNSVRITNLSSNLADNSARISLLNTWLQDNSFRITTNSDNLSSNHYRLTNVESNLVANSNRITNLTNDVNAIDGRVTVLESETSNLRVDLTSNVSILNDTIFDLSDNAGRVTTLELIKAPIDNPVFTGIISGDGGGISNVDLQHVTSDGNATTDTVRFTSSTVAFVTDSTVGIGTDDPDTNYTLHATGDIKVDSNVEATTFIAPGTHINLDGTNKLTGNTSVYGNLNVYGNVTYLDTENVYVKDPILGIGNPGAQDSGVIAMSGGPGSNVAFGYNNTDGEFIIAFTDDGPLGVTLTPNASRELNVHVYGTLYTANGFGVANTNPVSDTYALSIGQNVFAKHNGDLISIRSLADTGIFTSNVTTPVIESTGTNLEITAPNTVLMGNLDVRGATTMVSTTDLIVNDTVVDLANNNTLTSVDLGIRMKRPGANVIMAYQASSEELAFAHSVTGVTPDPTKTMNVHVYGNLEVDQGINVGSNVVINDFASNVIDADGSIAATIYYGDGGLLSNITQTLQGISEIGATTDQTIYFTNVTTGVNVTTSNVEVGGYYFGDGQFMTNVANLVILQSNVSILNQNIASNVSDLRTDLQSNVLTLNQNIASNVSDLRTDLQSNVSILNTNIASNVSDLRTDLQSNVSILNTNIASNVSDLRTDLQSNVSILNTNIASNVSDLRTDLQSNVSILNTNIASNVSDLRTDLQSNVSILNTNIGSNVLILNQNIASNVSDLRTDLQSNVSILNQNIASNVSDLRTDLQSNVLTLNQNIASNVSDLRTDLQSNVSILNQNIASNVSDLRTDLQSNVLTLNQNIASNVSDLRTDLQSNVLTLNQNIASNVSDLRSDLQSNVSILNTNIASNVSDLRTDLQSNVSILNTNIASNVSDLRTDLQSNVSILNTNIASNVLILNQNIASNVSDLRTDIQSNVSIINSNVDLKADILDPTFSSNITVSNNLVMSDLTATRVVFVGANKELTDAAALTFDSSTLTVDGDVSVSGNLMVEGAVVQLSTVNTIVNDGIIELGNNNSSDTLDLGIIMTRPSTNVAIGYRGDEAELMIGHTLSDPSSTDLLPDSANTLAVHVYGNLEVESTITGDGQFLSNVANLVILQSNVSVLNQNIGSNVSDLRTDLQSNVSILNQNIASNVSDLRTDLQSNVSVLNQNIASNVSDLRTDLQSNVLILNQNIASNVSDLRTDIASNVSIINSNVDLKADILDPTFSSNITVSNNIVMSDLTPTRVVFVGADKQLTDSSTLIFNSDTLTVDGNVVADTISIGRSSVTGSNVLDINGSANALVYYGDGGLLSNIRTDFESVIIEGNTTSNVVEFMNATTAFITDLTSNVVMNVNQLNNVTITTGDLVDQQILRYDAGNGQWVNDNTDRNFVRVYNGSGLDIAKGKTVYVYNSHNNNVANVALARSDDPSTMPCIGVTLEAITAGTEGYAVAYGKVQGVNTSGFIEGETLYVSNVSAGGVSNIKPYSIINTVDQIQNIGICVKADTNGVVFVTGVGRSNDIPNANVVTSNGDLNYVYVNDTNNDMLKIAPTNLLTKLQTLTQVVDTGNVTSNVVQFTNITTGLVATSNVHAGAFYGEGSTLSFTSNVFIEEGLVVNKNSVASKQYAYTGSMTFSNVGVTFSTNVFSAKITAHLVHDDDEVSTIQIDCCGGSKNGTSAHNIVAGKVNKFGVTTSYPWNHEVTTTPTQVIWEPEQAGSTNYDYDIHVELLSSHPSAGVTQITEAGSAVKYFSH